MRKIKDSIIEKWFDCDNYVFDIMLDVNHMHRSPGAHEREEAKAIVLDSSFSYMGQGDYFEEIKEKIESVLSFLDFNHYFYGITPLPASLLFHEKDDKVLSEPMTASFSYTLLEYKEKIREASPDIVVLYTIFKKKANGICGLE